MKAQTNKLSLIKRRHAHWQRPGAVRGATAGVIDPVLCRAVHACRDLHPAVISQSR